MSAGVELGGGVLVGAAPEDASAAEADASAPPGVGVVVGVVPVSDGAASGFVVTSGEMARSGAVTPGATLRSEPVPDHQRRNHETPRSTKASGCADTAGGLTTPVDKGLPGVTGTPDLTSVDTLGEGCTEKGKIPGAQERNKKNSSNSNKSNKSSHHHHDLFGCVVWVGWTSATAGADTGLKCVNGSAGRFVPSE